MVVAEVAKTDIIFFNQEEVVGEAYQEVEQSKEEEDVDEASQTKKSKEEVEQSKEELVLMESEVDVTLKKRHALTDAEINERAFKMACRMNQLHAHLDELLPGVLLESFIQRPISQDEKYQVDQVWSLRKDKLSSEAMKDNTTTYKRIGH
ncbi:hypothetical protein GIB67_012331 [Kingdonia uniflora]|uniref:Uncharacterized protein n=1 Tax=Kingdonia uniflora TaxID=39325 RepID=A0A7J7MVP7_9MAGN|nr:hypothetical protein GIB67_012331 [Kingdonia uniflora]